MDATSVWRRIARKTALPTAVIAGGAALVLAACGAAGGADASPGPAMYRGGPAHTGSYPGDGGAGFDGLRWRFPTEGPVRSTPAVAGGRIYFGSADGHVYALDLAGRPLWKTDLGSAVTSSPAVVDGRVFVQSRQGVVAALSAETGAVAWRTETGPEVPFEWGYESGDIYVSSPAVVDGTVVVGSGDGHLRALDARDGRELWRLKTDGRVRSSPAVAEGAVFAGSADGSLYAADLRTGRLRWRFDTQGRALRSAQFGFDRKTIQSSPAVAGGTVYVGGRDGFLYAVDAATGKEAWRVDHRVSWVITSPAVRDGRVYAGSSDAKFFQAVDATTGREIWRVSTPSVIWSSPSVAGDTVYVGDGAGAVHAYDAQTGRERWSYRTGGGVFTAVVPVEGALLVGSEDGAVYALGTGSGGPLRRIVYWDAAYAKAAWLSEHESIRDDLAALGHEVMDTQALAAFFESSLQDGSASRSTVTFAIDHLPAELAGPQPAQGPLRRYLDAGGKVVWIGFPPLIWPRDPKTGKAGSYSAVDRRSTQELLGVDFTLSNFGLLGMELTDAGRARGLRGWWRTQWAVAPAGVTEILAHDENGLASAWVKSYGGKPGSGFVMLGRPLDAWRDPGALAALADHRPR